MVAVFDTLEYNQAKWWFMMINRFDGYKPFRCLAVGMVSSTVPNCDEIAAVNSNG